MTWHSEKNFAGMYAEFSHALWTGEARNMPTAQDGLLATRISREATKQAIHDREQSSQAHHSTLLRATDEENLVATPLDLNELDETPPPRKSSPPKRKTR